MQKLLSLLSVIGLFQFSLAQVGINTDRPNSTLAIHGSFQPDYKEISGSYTLSDVDYYITFNGNTDSFITLPAIKTGVSSFTGRIYKIKNISTHTVTLLSNDSSLRINDKKANNIIIEAGSYIEVVNNNSGWDVSFLAVSSKPEVNNVYVYGTQVKIPPHTDIDWNNNVNKSYDTTDWKIISKNSQSEGYYVYTSSYAKPSKMVIVYEFQGKPMEVEGLYPILTAGNNASYPDIFVASFISLINDTTTGKTRLTVSINRVDFFGSNSSGNNSNWWGTFLLNVLLAKVK